MTLPYLALSCLGGVHLEHVVLVLRGPPAAC